MQDKNFSGWETTGQTLSDMTLIEVLKQGESYHDKEEPYTRTGARTAPGWFPEVCHQVASEQKVSFAQLCRLTQKHGAVIFQEDQRTVKLQNKYRALRTKGIDVGNGKLLTRISYSHPYDFNQSTHHHTTLNCIAWVKATLSELASIYGLATYQVTILAMIASIATLPDNRGYKQLIDDELASFWAEVERRCSHLE